MEKGNGGGEKKAAAEAVSGGEGKASGVGGEEKPAPACFTKTGGDDAKFLDATKDYLKQLQETSADTHWDCINNRARRAKEYVTDQTSSGEAEMADCGQKKGGSGSKKDLNDYFQPGAEHFVLEEIWGGQQLMMMGRRGGRRTGKKKDRKDQKSTGKTAKEIVDGLGDQKPRGFPPEDEEEEDKENSPNMRDIDDIIAFETRENKKRAEDEKIREEELMVKLKLQQVKNQSQYEEEEARRKEVVRRQEAERVNLLASFDQTQRYLNKLETSADTHWDCIKNRASRAKEYVAEKTSSVNGGGEKKAAVNGGEGKASGVGGEEKPAPACFTKTGGDDAKFLDATKDYLKQLQETSADTHWDCIKNRARRAKEYVAEKTSSGFGRKKVEPEVKGDATTDVKEGGEASTTGGRRRVSLKRGGRPEL